MVSWEKHSSFSWRFWNDWKLNFKCWFKWDFFCYKKCSYWYLCMRNVQIAALESIWKCNFSSNLAKVNLVEFPSHSNINAIFQNLVIQVLDLSFSETEWLVELTDHCWIYAHRNHTSKTEEWIETYNLMRDNGSKSWSVKFRCFGYMLISSMTFWLNFEINLEMLNSPNP